MTEAKPTEASKEWSKEGEGEQKKDSGKEDGEESLHDAGHVVVVVVVSHWRKKSRSFLGNDFGKLFDSFKSDNFKVALLDICLYRFLYQIWKHYSYVYKKEIYNIYN